jgi:hypothetical protein
MSNLKWFSGITMDTSVRDIGWMWLLLVLCLVALVWCFWDHHKHLKK